MQEIQLDVSCAACVFAVWKRRRGDELDGFLSERDLTEASSVSLPPYAIKARHCLDKGEGIGGGNLHERKKKSFFPSVVIALSRVSVLVDWPAEALSPCEVSLQKRSVFFADGAKITRMFEKTQFCA